MKVKDFVTLSFKISLIGDFLEKLSDEPAYYIKNIINWRWFYQLTLSYIILTIYLTFYLFNNLYY